MRATNKLLKRMGCSTKNIHSKKKSGIIIIIVILYIQSGAFKVVMEIEYRPRCEREENMKKDRKMNIWVHISLRPEKCYSWEW